MSRAYKIIIVFVCVLAIVECVRVEHTRIMLNARARIQVTIIKTGLRRDAFTNEEKQILSEDWSPAEYNLVEPNPFEQK